MNEVSVLVVVRDGAATLEEALSSALAERPLEVVVVDDGSTDASREIAARLGARVISQPPLGPAAARNAAVAAARGSRLAFLDADDRWPAGRLAALLAPLSDPSIDASCGAQRLFGLGVRNEVWRGRHLGAMVLRAEAVRRVGDFAVARGYADTVDWLSRAGHTGMAIAFVDEIVLERRVHTDNLTRRYESDMRSAYMGAARAALARRRASEAST